MEIGLIEMNALAYLGVFVYYIVKKRSIDVGFLLLTIYVLASLSSVMFYHHFMFSYTIHDNKPLQLVPFVYLFVLLMICFYPILKYKPEKEQTLECFDEFKLSILVYFLFGISLISIIFFIPEAVNGMTGDIALNREDVMTDEKKMDMNGIANIFQNISKYLMNFSLVLFFYSLCFRKYYKYVLLLIVPAFIFPVVFSMVYSARGGIVFLLMNSIFIFVLVKRYMDPLIRKIFLIGISSVGGILALIFIIITLARFGDTVQGMDYFMYKYAGESFVNFDGILWPDIKNYLDGNTCFPGVRKLLGLDYRTSIYDFRLNGEHITHIPVYIFYTFIGDLVCDFGKIIPVFIILVFSRLIHSFFKPSQVLELRTLMVMALIISILGEGVLFFSYQTSNMTFVLTFFLYLFLRPTSDVIPEEGGISSYPSKY